MRKRFSVCGLLLCFYALASASVEDSVSQRQREHIDSFILNLHSRGQFNGSIIVAQNGKILYEKSIGLANFYNGDSIKPDYAYQMASVSKSITAAAIMLLYQQHEIDLEDKISKYFPELAFYSTVRVKHLLNHTSGIPEYISRFKTLWKKDAYMTNNDLLAILAKKKFKLAFVPGSRFVYCNTNYALLAKLVERVTDQEFGEFVRSRIFEPLGMCNSIIFNPTVDTLACRRIQGYFWNGNRYMEITTDYRNGVVGDKGVFSTARDMMLFEQILYTNILFTKETIERTLSKTLLNNGKESEYGCGWRIRMMDSMPVVLHYGFWNSFRTGLICFPESHTTFVILNNTTGYKHSAINNRDVIIRELLLVLFPKKGEPVEVIASDQENPTPSIEGEGE